LGLGAGKISFATPRVSQEATQKEEKRGGGDFATGPGTPYFHIGPGGACPGVLDIDLRLVGGGTVESLERRVGGKKAGGAFGGKNDLLATGVNN